MRILRRVLRKPDAYARKAVSPEEDPDLLKIVHNGDTDYGKILYVIKENSGLDGFCCTLRFIICFVRFAEQHGFVPRIVLSRDFLYFDEEKSREIPNPWEYYFVPASAGYDENRALHVCYAEYCHLESVRRAVPMNAYSAADYQNEETFRICTPILQRYLRLKPEITEAAAALLQTVKESGTGILGVHFRGTDFKREYDRHPVYVNEEQTIEEIRKALDTGAFGALFLATDDAAVYGHIRDALGDIPILQHADVFRSSGDRSVAFCGSSRRYHHYLLGYEIARDMYTLSLCDGLVAGKSSVSFVSSLYKRSRDEAYSYMRIIDNGNHRNGNKR